MHILVCCTSVSNNHCTICSKCESSGYPKKDSDCLNGFSNIVVKEVTDELCNYPDVDTIPNQPILRLYANLGGPAKGRRRMGRRRHEVEDSEKLCGREIADSKGAKSV